VLREPGLVDRIRATRDAGALYAVMTQIPHAA
jgi:PTS system nitrogen regulatory IIA component